MPTPAHSALDTAAAALHGKVIRTSASVIGHRGADTIIVATTAWGYTVTVVLSHMRIAFIARPRGWLRKSLLVEGSPAELVDLILDEEHYQRILAVQPLSIELAPAALRIEHKYGQPADMPATIDLAVLLAKRARDIDAQADDEHFAITA